MSSSSLSFLPLNLRQTVADLYNSTLREGFIPHLLKSAIVHPLAKVTPLMCIEDDVRSISLTCQLAKVLEGFTLARVYRGSWYIDRAGPCLLKLALKALAPVVQTLDSAIHRINLYPADSEIDFCNTYPLDSDLSGR